MNFNHRARMMSGRGHSTRSREQDVALALLWVFILFIPYVEKGEAEYPMNTLEMNEPWR